MFEAEEEWMSAIEALICRSHPDSKLEKILGIERTDKRYGVRKKPERTDKRYGAKLTKLAKQCFDDTKHLYPFLVASKALEWEQLSDGHRLHFYKQVRPSIEHNSEDHMLPDPDPKPLADMLRSERPIPAGIRDTLAELLDPGHPEYLGCKLELKDT